MIDLITDVFLLNVMIGLFFNYSFIVFLIIVQVKLEIFQDYFHRLHLINSPNKVDYLNHIDFSGDAD